MNDIEFKLDNNDRHSLNIIIEDIERNQLLKDYLADDDIGTFLDWFLDNEGMSYSPIIFLLCSGVTLKTILNNSYLDTRDLFCGCNSVIKVNLPKIEGFSYIDERMFQGCESLEEVYIEDGWTTVGEETFEGCKSLTKVSLPSTIIDMDLHAFDDTPKLKYIEFRGTKEQFRAISFGPTARDVFSIHLVAIKCTDGDISVSDPPFYDEE